MSKVMGLLGNKLVMGKIQEARADKLRLSVENRCEVLGVVSILDLFSQMLTLNFPAT